MPKTKRNNVLDDLLIKQITETAIEVYKSHESKELKLKQDRRLHNVKQLLKNYKRIEQSVSRGSFVNVEDESDTFNLRELMSSEFVVESISQSKFRSNLMKEHVDKTLKAYKEICKVENIEERYSIVYDRYILNLPAHELWDKYFISKRTLYRELDRACEDLAVLLFGVDAVSFKVD